jgi:hypothetical protein
MKWEELIIVGLVSLVVVVIGLIIEYRTGFFSKRVPRKALSYDITSLTPLLSVKDEIKGKLEIYFDGKPVQDVRLVVLTDSDINI